MNTCYNPKSPVKAPPRFLEIVNDISQSSVHIVITCVIGCGLSIALLCCFLYFTEVAIYVIVSITTIGNLIVIGVCVFYSFDSDEKWWARGLGSIFLFLFMMSVPMASRTEIVVRLFQETTKVMFGMPLIMFTSLLTFLTVSAVLIILVLFLLIFTADNNPSGVIMFTQYYFYIIVVWMIHFIIGCQHMVIAGAVTAYYFARNKTSLASPFSRSFFNVRRYHLGTVAIGSAILTFASVLKHIIFCLCKYKSIKEIVEECLKPIINLLRLLSKNAYIQTAMHGQPFFKSGDRAVRLLSSNALTAIAINSVGDFVLFLAKLLIVLSSIGLAYPMRDSSVNHYWVVDGISVFVIYFISDCFFSVFEDVVDTLFLCFCEDMCMNDGVEKPYYMTTDCMKCMDFVKKKFKEESKSAD